MVEKSEVGMGFAISEDKFDVVNEEAGSKE